jgi:phenylacetic acid degradation operon negative regulatory protein
MSVPTRMTARSVVLSVLLGAHPACAAPAELTALTADFGIQPTALRVALTRMVAAGDLVRAAAGYQLSERLLARQRRQDDALAPRLRGWDGSWLTVLVTAVGVDARLRADLRKNLQDNRFGELREGVWLRPDNQDQTVDGLGGRVRILRSVDAAPAELAGLLWDLPGWAATADDLLAAMAEAADVPSRFVLAAGMVRHLLTDPVLPAELLPPDWPGERLRTEYARFAAELADRRQHPVPMGQT